MILLSDKLLEKFVTRGERPFEIASIVMLSVGANLLTPVLENNLQFKVSEILGLFLLACGILCFFLSEQIRDAFLVAGRLQQIELRSKSNIKISSIQELAVGEIIGSSYAKRKFSDLVIALSTFSILLIVTLLLRIGYAAFTEFTESIYVKLFLQLLLNGILAGTVHALVGLSFSVIYSIVRFFHFAHGTIFALGPYLLLSLLIYSPFAVLPAAVIATIIAAMIGVSTELAFYRPLRRRRADTRILLVTGLGILIIIQNLISLAFADETQVLLPGRITEAYTILGARVSVTQALIALVAITLCVATDLILRLTRLGVSYRAVAGDPDLAQVLGIPKERLILFSFFWGSVMAAASGILVSLDLPLTPTMGFQALLYGATAMIIGGSDSTWGIFAGGLLVGLVQHLSVLVISSAWQDAIVFAVLIFFLLLRPTGFSGQAVRRVTV
jgi:branched-chain amino acid transport system permease protein